MDLHNHTPYPALLSRFGAENDVMGASLVVRISYSITADRRLVPSTDQTWPVSPTPWACDYGPMEADNAFYKGGTDLFVFGSACAPQRRPVTTMKVIFEIGGFQRELAVFGDRTWARRGGDLVISPPQTFVTMPLTMENAFGGAGTWDGLEIPCADNPHGKGFYLEAAHAAGKPLPNVEEPRSLIRRWDDRPTPVGVGVCPPAFSTRLDRGMTYTKEGALDKLHPRLFNSAFPEMVVEEALKAGDEVRLTGVAHDAPLEFILPETPVTFWLRFDDASRERVPGYDQIGVEVDKRRVFITYRYAFRYVLYKRQSRQAELVVREVTKP